MAGEFQLRGFAPPVSVEGGYQAAGDAARDASIQRNAWSRALREEFDKYGQRAYSRDLLEMQMNRADKRDALTRDYDRMARATEFERRKDLGRLDYDMRSQLQGEKYEQEMVQERLKAAQKKREEAAYTHAMGIVFSVMDEARANKAHDPIQRIDRPLKDLHPQFAGKTDDQLRALFRDRNPSQDEAWVEGQLKAISRPGGVNYVAPGLFERAQRHILGTAQESGLDGKIAQQAFEDYWQTYKDIPFDYKNGVKKWAEEYDKGINEHFRPESPRDAQEGNAFAALLEQVQSTKQSVPGPYPGAGPKVTPREDFNKDGQMMLGPQSGEAGIVDMPDKLTNPAGKPGDIISSVYGKADPVKLQSSLLKEIGISTAALMPRDSPKAAELWLERLEQRNVTLDPVIDSEGKITGVKIAGDVDDLRSENADGLRDIENALNSYDGLLSVIGFMLRPAGTREERHAAARLVIKHTPDTDHSTSNPELPGARNFIGEGFGKFK